VEPKEKSDINETTGKRVKQPGIRERKKTASKNEILEEKVLQFLVRKEKK